MGAGMMFILLLIVVAAVIAALLFSGTGAALWARKTASPEATPATEPDAEERAASDPGDAHSSPESTVAPDANGVYHREFR
jgi:hypothetical protein